MEAQQRQKKVTQNPLLNQFKIIKQKLQQRGISIIQLNKQLQIQRKAMLQTLSEFQAHEKKIMTRLRRLEQINFKYIKQYAQIKKIAPPQELSAFMSDKINDSSARQVLIKKIDHYKQYYSESIQGLGKGSFPALQKTVTTICEYIRSYLEERRIDYQKAVEKLSDQKRKRLKEVKGIEAYKASKQQQKLLDSLKTKINNFKLALPTIHEKNLIELLSMRRQIEYQIGKLDPSRQELTLEQSLKQQSMLSQLIEEIVMVSTEDCQADQITEVFLNSQFKFVQNAALNLTELYGEDFITQNINKIEKLSVEMKEGIMKGLSRRELVEISRRQRQLKGQSFNEESADIQFNQDPFRGFSENKKSMKSRKYRQARQRGDNLEQQNPDYTQQAWNEQGGMKMKFINNQDSYQSGMNEYEQIQPGQQNLQKESSGLGKGLQKPQQKHGKQSRLNASFQTTMTKTFFQEQQKTRDTLIAKQNTELQQHQKVIGKLITFIKKQFKQKKLDQIDADDPQQLMGYYFKINQKKVFQIKEELKGVETEKKMIEKEKKDIFELNLQLYEEKQNLTNENKDLQEKKEYLQTQTRELIQQIKVIEVNWVTQKQRVVQLVTECENLKLKLELQKLQILSLSQIYEKVKANTIQFHSVTQSTENIVKLSLSTLFNLCLDNLKPQQIIQRLEKIIEIIKVNVKLKRDLIYDLSISEFIEKEQQNAKTEFASQITKGLILFKDTPNNLKKQQFVNQYLVPPPSEKEVDDKQSLKVFLDHLREIQIKLVQKQLKPAQVKDEQIEKKQDKSLPQQIKVQSKEQQQNHENNKLFEMPQDFLFPFLSNMIAKIEQNKNKPESAKIDQNFIDGMIQNIRKIKESKVNNDQEDINQMYQKYKQAVDCLERSQQLNKDYQMKYQAFLNDLKKKGAYEAPQVLQEKLFYMQRVISQQNELLQNQRKQFENTIMKQVEKSEELAQSVLQSIKISRRKTNPQKSFTQT